MANVVLTDAMVRGLPRPASGSRIVFDAKIRGFAVRLYATGAASYILAYRSGRVQRRLVIGNASAWTLSQARAEATRLRRLVESGTDPLGVRQEARTVDTIADLAQICRDLHLPTMRPRSRIEAEGLLRRYILPALRHYRVDTLSHGDVQRWHREITKEAPIAANRAVALLSVMLNLAVKHAMRVDNPCRHVAKNAENRRERYLSPDELRRLMSALDAHPLRQSANAIMLLLLTGARRGEVLNARWSQIDLDAATWTKPAAFTKQKRLHHVPLMPQAIELLRTMRRESNSDVLFPGGGRSGTQAEIKRFWQSVTKIAGLDGVRLHDLRHSFASTLINNNVPLPVIGALLGHTQPTTTARYAHLATEVLKQATDIAGVAIANARKVSRGK